MTNIFDINKSAALFTINSIPEVKKICQPLQDYLGISCFGYLRLYHNCSFITLINGNEEYLAKHHEFIKTQDLQFTSMMKSVSEKKPHFFLWPKNFKKLPPILSLLKEHNIWHGLSIYYRHTEYIECFSFAFDRNSDDKSQFFIENSELLAKFCDYFKIQAADLINIKEDSRLACYKEKFDISYSSELNDNKKRFIAEINSQQHNKLVNQSGKIVTLTKRESDCISVLMQNKTAKEIAAILSLSPRTVEHYLGNVKEKLEVNYKGQLIDVLKLNRLRLLDF